MANRIYIPFLNSIKFVEETPTEFPQYDKPLFDYSLAVDQLLPFQEQKCYAQKRTSYDADSFQFISNYDPIQIEVLRKSDDALMLVVAAQNIRRNTYQPDYYIYEVDVSYASLEPGRYYMKMTTGSGAKVFISEDIEITTVEGTVLFEYAHSEYYGEVVFETDISMALRVEGCVLYDTPGAASVIYTDQPNNNTMLSYQPYDVFKLFIGGPEGIPNYLQKKINAIVGCDDLRINGEYFCIAEGAKWEKAEQPDYPFRGWTIELRQQLNRQSTIFDTETGNGRKLMVAHNIESKGFGDISENQGSNIVTIIDIE